MALELNLILGFLRTSNLLITMTFEQFMETSIFDEIDACLFSETNWHLYEIDNLFNVTDWEEYTKCSSAKEAADNIWADTYARKKKMARRFIH